MEVHERIKNRRLELGLSADDVAEALNVSRATVYRYESAAIEKLPTSILGPLSQVLHCTPAYLMGWESNDEYDQALALYQKYLQAPEQARQTIDYILKLQQPDSES